MKVLEPKATHDLFDGVIEGQSIKIYKKRFVDIMGIYKKTEGVDPDTLMYTVYSMEEEPDKSGELYWGLTILEPVYVNGECNMTRGHFHENRECAEYYFGLGGEGLLMLMDENGKTWAERIYQGSLHHISGNMAHRLINTSDVPMKVGACWPAAAGHDYDAIEKHEFGFCVMKKENTIFYEERDV